MSSGLAKRIGVRGALSLAALAPLVLAACGDDGPAEAGVPTIVTEASDAPSSADEASGVEPTGVVHSIVALDNSFRPQQLEAAVGDEVVWENRGINEHNVLSIEGDAWGVEVADFQPGSVFSHVFTEPGEYRYYCSIHGSDTVGMVGTVTVTG